MLDDLEDIALFVCIVGHWHLIKKKEKKKDFREKNLCMSKAVFDARYLSVGTSKLWSPRIQNAADRVYSVAECDFCNSAFYWDATLFGYMHESQAS